MGRGTKENKGQPVWVGGPCQQEAYAQASKSGRAHHHPDVYDVYTYIDSAYAFWV